MTDVSAETDELMLFFVSYSEEGRKFPAQGCELCCDWKPRGPEGGELY